MIKDVIKLSIPRKPDYVSLVRLTTSGIAHSMGLNIDDIEDIKVCIGEACINSLSVNNSEEIKLVFEVTKDKLTIRVNNVEEISEEITDELETFKELELGLLIIKSLMDEVYFNEFGIEMIKYIEDDVNDYK